MVTLVNQENAGVVSGVPNRPADGLVDRPHADAAIVLPPRAPAAESGVGGGGSETRKRKNTCQDNRLSFFGAAVKREEQH